MTYMVSQRALVLHEIIRGIDCDIKIVRERGEDTSELEAERKRRANECMMYLNSAVKVKRSRLKPVTRDTRDNNDSSEQSGV